MIVCSCQNISDADIHAAINWMRTSDETSIITPGKIYHALGKTLIWKYQQSFAGCEAPPRGAKFMKGDKKVIEYLNKALRVE